MSETTRAESLFEDFLRRRERGEAVDREALCRAHPQHAVELRSLLKANDLVRDLLPDPQDRQYPDVPPSDLLAQLSAAGIRGTRYRVLGEIGHGGMAVVYRVWDAELRRQMAMKVVGRAGTRADARTLARFMSEAQITGQLDHPGIVPVHEIGRNADGRIYFTMRLVPGTDLRTVFEKVHSGAEGWNLLRAVRVLLKVCEAMSYAHRKRILHRDLKPANVMVGEFGDAYVMDWGLARVLGQPDPHELRQQETSFESPRTVRTERDDQRDSDPDSPLVTKEGHVLGTAGYMAPEQARGEVEHIGPQSDVYAVGAMLYELIAGHMPFLNSGESLRRAEILERVKEGPPHPLAALGRKAPVELVAICEKAMARETTERYSDMQALAADLRAFDEGRVVQAYQTGTWAETRKWLRRNRALAGTLLAAIAILVGGVVAVLVFAVDAHKQRLKSRAWSATLTANAALDEFLKESSDWEHAATLTDASNQWLNKARSLLAGRLPDGVRVPDLETLRAQLQKLQLGAQIEPGAINLVMEYPRREALDRARIECRWQARILRKSQFPPLGDVEAALSRESLPADAKNLNGLAWDIVDPRLASSDQEIRGLALSRLAVAVADEEWKTACRDTLAWAYFRTGQFDAAIAESMAVTAANPRGFDTDVFYAPVGEFIDYWKSRDAQMQYEQLSARVRRMEDDARTWAFICNQEPADARPFEEFADLVRRLEDLQNRVRIAEQALREADASISWARAIEAIRTSDRYGGNLVIAPQLDLLPLGADPQSGLWEFAHLPSGLPPGRDRNGMLLQTPSTGLVFVLLPGGTGYLPIFNNGKLEGEERISIKAFFLAKFPMSIEQFDRLWPDWTGKPMVIGPLRPMTMLSWDECAEVLRRAGSWLRMPSQAQLTYAWRAGGSPPWWPNDAGRILYQRLSGYRPPPPLGASSANPFGLHDIEVEWCQDSTDPQNARPDDGLMDDPKERSRRVLIAQRADPPYQYEAVPRDVRRADHLRPGRLLTR